MSSPDAAPAGSGQPAAGMPPASQPPSGHKSVDPRQTDQSRDVRRLIIYFGVLVAVYAVGFALKDSLSWNTVIVILMFAPMAGALAARYLGPGIIWWGRPSWWILAALVPVVVGLAVLLAANALGAVTLDDAKLRSALFGAVLTIFVACLTAIGEEVGWRGFLWPLLRGRYRFLAASAVMCVIWLAYHIPLVVTGDYGTVRGLPAFTIALIGFALFVGVLTDRSRSIWPSVVAHGGWNALVATGFDKAFVGDGLVGEFGWINAAGMLALGVATTVWHLRSGYGAVIPPGPSRESVAPATSGA